MSRLIEDEFDELVLYVAGLKKTLARKMDDHLFLIQQQNERLDDQARLIDELAWQIRDLRASVRSVNDKLKVVEEGQQKQRQNASEVVSSSGYCNKCDGGGGGTSSITKPRIIVNKVMEELNEDEDETPYKNIDRRTYTRPMSSNSRETYNDGEGLYEMIQFVADERRRDYKAPPASSPTSLSAIHRQAKLKQQQPLPPIPSERRLTKNDPLLPFHFPPPPPIETLDEPQEVPLRAKDYTSVVRRNRNNSTGSATLAMVKELAEDMGTGSPDDEPREQDFMRTRRSASEREANSLRRRAYILPSTSRTV